MRDPRIFRTKPDTARPTGADAWKMLNGWAKARENMGFKLAVHAIGRWRANDYSMTSYETPLGARYRG